MTDGAPTLLSLETGSAWFVILVVSLVTFPAVLLLRRFIGRPGGLASGMLLLLPLALPPLAALTYHEAALPEVAVLRPASLAVLRESGARLLFFSPDQGKHVIPYALSGSAGRWLVVVALAATLLMVVRKLVGSLLLRRLIVRAAPAEAIGCGYLSAAVARLAMAAGLRRVPEVLVGDHEAPAALATGFKRSRILLSRRLLTALEPAEIEAVLAHEVAHLAAADPPLAFAAGLLRDLIAWNPLAHLAFHRFTLDRELEADRRAASLTGRPLALASSLLRVWELGRGGHGPRLAAVTFFRPGSRVSRRVRGLLALSDGPSPTPMTAVPYLLAAALAGYLGLGVAAHLADGDGAFAIMWGNAPEVRSLAVWSEEDDIWQMKALGRAEQMRRPGGSKKKEHPQLAGQYLKLNGGFALRAADLQRWGGWTRRNGALVAPLGWTAEEVQVFSRPSLGPVNVLRMESRALLPPPGPPAARRSSRASSL